MSLTAYQRGKKQLYRLTVGSEAGGLRLDQWLAAEIPDLSRTEARKIVDIGGVSLDGRRVRTCSTNLRCGARLEIHTDGRPLEPYRLSAAEIVYQDKYILVINKPAGIETQPTPARYKGTLYEALQVYLGPTPGRKKPELGMVQRLDRGTTGLMVFSIHPKAHRGLSKIFLEHQVDKRYLALVQQAPNPAKGEIRSLLARSRRLNRMVSVERGGKEAITRYSTPEKSQQAALLELKLFTGRTHQIRVHLSEEGSALLGDTLYGGVAQLDQLHFSRPLLHAFYLSFLHPVNNQRLEFELPMPEDMQAPYTQLIASQLTPRRPHGNE